MNWPTGIITVLIAIIFFVIIFKQVRDHKRGISSCACGGNCKTCGRCGSGEKNP